MPTITHQPHWGSPAGYNERAFTEEHIEELATLLGCSASALRIPLQEVASALSLLRYTAPVPLPSQRAALRELADIAYSLHGKLTALDVGSKRHVLSEYATECREAASVDAPAASFHATDHLNKAIAALQRLAGNLGTASKKLGKEVHRGAPRKLESRFAAEKLIVLYESVLGIEFVNSTRSKKRAPREFVLRALTMLGIDQSSASNALDNAMKVRRKRSAQLPERRG